MSVTYGFYNSVNHDRKYDAVQISSIFDGIVVDGVLMHYGERMIVKAPQTAAMTVTVGSGRAWFNHTWTLNDSPLLLEVPQSEVLLHRIDAVVIEVDSREQSRQNSIHIVKGTPASNPTNPTLIKTNDRWQYPLCYIRVNAGVTAIVQANIINKVGTSDCPFCTAPLEKMEIDDLIAQWGDQWGHFYTEETEKIVAKRVEITNQWDAYYRNITGQIETEFDKFKNDWDTFYTEETGLITSKREEITNQWDTYYTNITTQIEDTFDTFRNDWTTFYTDYTAEMNRIKGEWNTTWNSWYTDYTTTFTNDMNEWKTTEQNAFLAWFDSVKNLLDEDVAASLVNSVIDLQKRDTELSSQITSLGDSITELTSSYNALTVRVEELEEKWDILENTHTVWSDFKDNNSEDILDSSGEVIEGREIYVLL